MMKFIKYILWLAFTILLLVGAYHGKDLEKITPWLLGVSFTISIFSVNFTFFGHQLSKYKAIYSRVSKRQWGNIIVILLLPFVPLISYLYIPEYFGVISLGILPFLVLSAIDNASLTAMYLNPKQYIRNSASEPLVNRYLSSLEKEIEKEVMSHKTYLSNMNKFQIPVHGFKYEPTVLGLDDGDVWDAISVVAKLSIENNDYSVFRTVISAAINVLIGSYTYSSGHEEYYVDSGIKLAARKRFRSIINQVVDTDSNGIFLQSLSGELSASLMNSRFSDKPCSEMTRAVASDAVWIGKKMLETNCVSEPLKILNTIQAVAELTVHRLEATGLSDFPDNMDRYDISAYAHDIKELGIAALHGGNSHFAYRCMESLSYLGCNAAKLKSKEVVGSVFESIVHLGRVSRNLGIGCFYARCLIPAESHAEEFMGHILTWLVADLDEGGAFFMKEHAEQAYSRLRGVKCAVCHKPNLNPKFWIEELEKNGQRVPHIEHESGMFGYDGALDYSDFKNLKEYHLYGIGSGSNAMISYSDPISFNIDEVEAGEDSPVILA